MDDFIFDDEEIIKRILREHNRPLRETSNNTETKDIGDRVMVLDNSSLTNMNGIELSIAELNRISPSCEYLIVIDTKNTFKFNTFTQDLIVVNPETNEQFKVASRHMRIYRRF